MSDIFMARTPGDTRPGPSTLTVVISDAGPTSILGEPTQHRSVRIQLTAEQRAALSLRCTGINCGKPLYEFVSQAFFEPD